jgi:hypothetical protein
MACLTLLACSYSYPLDVSFSDGKVIFSAKEHSSGCLSDLEVTSEAGETMWKFQGPLRFVDCRNEFPLVYGHLPSGTTAPRKAKPLRPNVTYYIYASDGDTYYGSFRIKPVLVIDSDPEGGHNGPYFRNSLSDLEAIVNDS